MRRWWFVLTGSVLVLLAAPAAWFVTRPSASDGVPVASVGVSSAAPSVSPSAPSDGGPALPRPTARPATAAPADVRPAQQPAEIRIPAIDVVAEVDPVGVKDDGSMVLPEDVDRVGWYRYGSPPGAAAGAAVLAGHVDSREQGLGVLVRLRELEVGDRIDVEREDGSSLRYAVVGKQTLVKKRLPTEKLFARSGSPRLVLITCGGEFIRELSGYQSNVVVVAEPVGDDG